MGRSGFIRALLLPSSGPPAKLRRLTGTQIPPGFGAMPGSCPLPVSFDAADRDLRIELKLATARAALGILIIFLFTQLDLGAEAPGAFQVGEKFLYTAPLPA